MMSRQCWARKCTHAIESSWPSILHLCSWPANDAHERGATKPPTRLSASPPPLVQPGLFSFLDLLTRMQTKSDRLVAVERSEERRVGKECRCRRVEDQ